MIKNTSILYCKPEARLHFPLTNTELYYMRLLVYNASPRDMCKFLNVNHKDLHLLKDHVYSKFKKKSWFSTIAILHEHDKTLNHHDLCAPYLKPIALSHATKILTLHEETIDMTSFEVILNTLLQDFFEAALAHYSRLKPLLTMLSRREVRIIRYMMTGFSLDRFKYRAYQLKMYKIHLYNRFESHNHFDLLRKVLLAMQAQQISTNIALLTPKILAILNDPYLPKWEKHLSLQSTLLKLYLQEELLIITQTSHKTVINQLYKQVVSD